MARTVYTGHGARSCCPARGLSVTGLSSHSGRRGPTFLAFPAVVGGHWWLVTSSEATVPACSVYSVDAGTGRGGLGWDPDNTPHMPAAAQRPLRRGRCKTAPPEPVPRTGLLPPPSRGASPGPIAHLAARGAAAAGVTIASSYHHNIAPACHQTEVDIIFSADSRSKRGAGHQTQYIHQIAPTHTRHHSLHTAPWSSIARYPAWAAALHNTRY